MSHTLNPLTLPLWGSRLIEASAGTGKTWTIAALYLRLVLGHGAPDETSGAPTAFGRPLVPSEILVMTFTRAATRELSDRVRARLLEAARCFRGEKDAAAGDDLLQGLLASFPDEKARRHAAWRLATAAESMDDAAIHTIDAWCQRMLREHAFDSGCLFNEELSSDEAAVRQEAVQDYWRQQLYPLTGEALDAALAVWKNLAALAKDAEVLLQQDIQPSWGDGDLGTVLEQAQAEQRDALTRLKNGWDARAEAMQIWIEGQLAASPCAFDGRKLGRANVTRWLAALAAWAKDPAAVELDLKTGNTRFTPEGMHEALKAGQQMVLPPEFAAFGQLMSALAELAPPAVRVRLHAAARISARVAQLKRQSGTFGFADMLQRLDHALDPAHNGEAALRLRDRMLAQYPVALIDEFQDTSPIQSRIFDRLYRIADNAPGQALLMIGDPKQSIYGFRGADIHSYLVARHHTLGRHYVLGTNHRSSDAMVEAVNQLFNVAEQRPGEGAFRYRSSGAELAANPLPFLPVAARGRPEVLTTAQGAMPALTLALDDALLPAKDARRRFGARCAEQIARLLNDPQAGFEEAGTAFQRLRPADIAVLVRSGVEAAAVRRELQRRRIASVYLSEKSSVFESDEAHDLLHWLKAVASPLDVRAVRAALATRTVDLSMAELVRLARDDQAFEERSDQLRELHRLWQQQGVLPMLRRSLHLLDLPARWLGTGAEGSAASATPPADGERRLTNFLHLSELLQAASAQLDGEQALIRWLGEQVLGEGERGDEQVVRLESDADLVQIITVHKSKGLEYPVVFLPFATSYRAVERKNATALNLVDDTGHCQLHLHLSAAHIAQAERERLNEDLRLLYVALTRARHAVWAGISTLKAGKGPACMLHLSALGYVLAGEAQLQATEVRPLLERLFASSPHTVLAQATPMDELPCTPLAARGPAPALRDALAYAANFERSWTIGSFSALVRDLPHTAGWATSEAVARDDERLPAEADISIAPAPVPAGVAVVSALAPWHSFPRGSLPGNFLHDQLQWLAEEGFDLASSPERQQQLQRRCERQGWAARAEQVVDWLGRVVQTTMPPVGAPLSGVRTAVAEMEFWFPSDQLSAAALDALCRKHLLHGSERPALAAKELRGMLMGFADMVFEHEGRYWVLDYKSNHLGAGDSDYSTASMEAAMAQHRYDVQAAIYLLALHRLLRVRLGEEYEPAQHLGGAVYFFLRGIGGPQSGCYHVTASLDFLDAVDALFTSSTHAALSAAHASEATR